MATYTCAECQLRGFKPCEHPWTAFGAKTEAEIWEQGEWARCHSCQRRHTAAVPKPPTETRQQSTKTVSTGACTPATETAEVSQCAWCRQPCTSSQLYVRTVPEAGQQRKVRLCPQCISCSQCGARLQGMKHSSRGGDNRCLKCCKANREDHNRLQQLWKLSRRKQCQCKKPVHTETCPMAPRQFGERPFPGCDVMTLAEYQQLQLQRKRLKAAKLQ